jgi:hypothetical protein
MMKRKKKRKRKQAAEEGKRGWKGWEEGWKGWEERWEGEQRERQMAREMVVEGERGGVQEGQYLHFLAPQKGRILSWLL